MFALFNKLKFNVNFTNRLKNQDGRIEYSMPWILGAPAWIILIGYVVVFALSPSHI